MQPGEQNNAIPLDYALPRDHPQRHPSRRDVVIRLSLAGLALIGLYELFVWVFFHLGAR